MFTEFNIVSYNNRFNNVNCNSVFPFYHNRELGGEGRHFYSRSPASSTICHCEAYPHLRQIAKVYLTLSASSVPVESMFCLAGLVNNSRRSSVAPHRLRLVHDNYANFFPQK